MPSFVQQILVLSGVVLLIFLCVASKKAIVYFFGNNDLAVFSAKTMKIFGMDNPTARECVSDAVENGTAEPSSPVPEKKKRRVQRREWKPMFEAATETTEAEAPQSLREEPLQTKTEEEAPAREPDDALKRLRPVNTRTPTQTTGLSEVSVVSSEAPPANKPRRPVMRK